MSVVSTTPTGSESPVRGGLLELVFSGDVPSTAVPGAFAVTINGSAATPTMRLVGTTAVSIQLPDDVVFPATVLVTLDRQALRDGMGRDLAGTNTFSWTFQRVGRVSAPGDAGADPLHLVAGTDGWLSLQRTASEITLQRVTRASFRGAGASLATTDGTLVEDGAGNAVLALKDNSGVTSFTRVDPTGNFSSPWNATLPAGSRSAVLLAGAAGDVAVAYATPDGGGGDNLEAMLLKADGSVVTATALGTGLPRGMLAVALAGDRVIVAVAEVLLEAVVVHEWNATSNSWAELGMVPHPAVEAALAARMVSSTAAEFALAVAMDTLHGPDMAVYDNASGTVSRLGGTLEKDILNDVGLPRVALSADGNPAVAFLERTMVGTLAPGADHVRVLVHDGNTWDSPSMPTPASGTVSALALSFDAFGMPMVAHAISITGARLHEGTYLNTTTLAPTPVRPSSTTCAIPDPPPALLSQTGCFADMATRTPVAGVVPFNLNSALYSDAAEKGRWIVLPAGTSITAADDGLLTVPVGTITIKDFMVPRATARGAPSIIAETRFMVRRDVDTWTGYSYEWRADGSDADLLPAPDDPVMPMTTAKLRAFTRDDGSTHTHTYPTRAQCLQCHNSAAGFVLGPTWGQLNKIGEIDGVHGPQLTLLTRAGYLTGTPTAPPATLPSPWDTTRSLQDRSRAYLHANCSACHRPGGPGAFMDLRYDTALADTNLCLNGRVVPGSGYTSKLHTRMAAVPGGVADGGPTVSPMPPLARQTQDTAAIGLIDSWIDGMTTCP